MDAMVKHLTKTLDIPRDRITTTVLFSKIVPGRPAAFDADVVGVHNLPGVWLVGYGLDDLGTKRGWTELLAMPKAPGEISGVTSITFTTLLRCPPSATRVFRLNLYPHVGGESCTTNGATILEGSHPPTTTAIFDLPTHSRSLVHIYLMVYRATHTRRTSCRYPTHRRRRHLRGWSRWRCQIGRDSRGDSEAARVSAANGTTLQCAALHCARLLRCGGLAGWHADYSLLGSYG